MAIPKVLTNKTILTGLAQSSVKGASLFKPASARVDKMGKVVAPTLVSSKQFGKTMGNFKADSSAHVTFGPTSLGKPFFISKEMVAFR